MSEPPWSYGPPLSAFLAGLGVPSSQSEGGARLEVVAIASRSPLPADEIGRLRELCDRRPTALIAFQSDAFLDLIPQAALRASACDPTPLTRQVVARMLVKRARQAAGV